MLDKQQNEPPPFRHCLRKKSINIVTVLGKYLENYRLLNFPHLDIIRHENKGVNFANRRKKEKCTNVTQMRKNIQKIIIFNHFFHRIYTPACKQKAYHMLHTYMLAKIRNIRLNMKIKK